MNKDNFTYYSAQFRNWVFKTALVFSVLSVSGINLHVHSQVNLSVKTELAETRNRKPAYRLNIQSEILVSRILSDYNTFCSRTILNHYNIIRSKFKSYQNRILLFSISQIHKRIKIPTSSTKDDTPLSLI